MNETFWVAVGSLITGATLIWSIFAFILKSREGNMARIDGDIKELKTIIEKQSETLNKLETDLAVQRERMANIMDKFEEFTNEIKKVIEKQGEALIALGKSIKVRDDL